MRLLSLLLVSVLAVTSPTQAEIVFSGESPSAGAFQVRELARGLGVPWGLEFVDEKTLIFTQRDGEIGLLEIDTGTIHAVGGAPPVRIGGQGGLLDVARSPGQSDQFYFTWVKDNGEGQGVTVLSRATLKARELVDWKDLLVSQSATDTGRHFGSRITFDQAGHLFFSVGDRGHRPNGQDLSTHAGTVIRLTVDGAVPPDNPFLDQPGALPEIWSYGHRNPQGLTYDAQNNRLWSIEHGPRGGDEINLIRKGENYGWAVPSYGKEYWGPFDVGEGEERPGMASPTKVYIPSIAPGSLVYYTGEAFKAWQGNLIAGALKLTHLNRVELDAQGNAVSEERLLESMGERIRALRVGPKGRLYFSTDSGRILRLEPQAAR